MNDEIPPPPSDGPTSLFGVELRTLILAPMIAFAPFIVVFVIPQILGLFGRLLGWSLRKKTDGRRSQLLTYMNEENKKYYTANKDAAAGGLGEGSKTDLDSKTQATLESQKDWSGIVGFFHPFWYVWLSSMRSQSFDR